ncbi:MAG: hypothetical protein Q8O34_03955 [Rhodocyclaceae bacterium]|nr:hypothetical protein [Rhodocyclaceae bacterium]
MIASVLKKLLPCACALLALSAQAEPERYLQSVGFTQVYNVKEGMAGSGAGPGWIKRGLPVETCTQQC